MRNKSFKESIRRTTGYHIDYLSGPAGSAKTEVIIEDICRRVDQYKELFIFAIPSIRACDEIAARIEAKGQTPKVIHSNTLDNQTVGVSISKWMESLDPCSGAILVITHSALYNIPYFPGNAPKHEWNLIHDETLDPTIHIELNLSYHRELINDVIKLPSAKTNVEFSTVKYCGDKDVSQQMKIVKNTMGDAIYSIMGDFNQAVLRLIEGKCDIFVHVDDYKKFQSGKGKKFVATAVLNPKIVSGFKHTLFAGANFEQELVYSLWRDFYRVEWRECTPLKEKLLFTQHSNRLIVKYIIGDSDPDFNWSKYKANLVYNGAVVSDLIDKISSDVFSSSDTVLWVGNKATKAPGSNFIKCEHNSQGLNQYSGISNMVYTGAFNRPPTYYRFMEWVGCSNPVKMSQTSGHLYQSVLRTCIRKTVANVPTTILVPSKSMFAPIEHLFTDIVFEQVEHDLVETVAAICEDKRKTKRLEPKIEKWKTLEDLQSSVERLCSSQTTETEREPPSCEDVDAALSESPFAVYASLYDDSGSAIRSDTPLDISPDDHDSIIAAYCSTKNIVFNRKENCALVGAFTLNDGANTRTRDAICSVFGQFIDFDTAKFKYKLTKSDPWIYTDDTTSIPEKCFKLHVIEPMSIDGVSSILGGETRFILNSTYSGGNRRRVFFLYNRSITPVEHLSVSKSIYKKFLLEFPDCGIDVACVRPESLVYLPCSTADKEPLVIDYGWRPFDVDEYLTFCVVPEVSNKYLPDTIRVQEDCGDFNSAMAPYISEMGPGKRFVIGQKMVSLCARKFPHHYRELESSLSAGGCTNKQIKGFMEWFMKIRVDR